MNIEVIKQKDPETREVYNFTTFDFNIVFTRYSFEQKPKGKRKYQRVKYWDTYTWRAAENAEPNLPDEIRQEAVNKAAKNLRACTWDEWKNKK